ncbi:MAG: marine proteobacterial sortase target protein [Acidobacteria bacterium]|nr:marine proteobacterial sortase target protein [Acidobacteriota bacterium]
MNRPEFRSILRTTPVVAVLAQILAITALLQPHAIAAPVGTVTPSGVGAGELLWKSPSGFVPLPVMDIRVSLRVTGIMVRGVVTQTFTNPAPEVIEAVYVFPLPEKAAVDALEMRIGERRIVAVLQEKEQAKATYAKARSEGKKAALLDQARPNLFQSAVANILPGESVHVRLEYVEELDYVDGVLGLHFPLTFTPRYSPEVLERPTTPTGDALFLPAWASGRPSATIEVLIENGLPLGSIRSDSHPIRIDEEGARRRVTLEGGTVVADRDFVLRWEVKRGDTPGGAVFVEDRPEGRYALAMLIPPDDGAQPGYGLPTQTMFILDISGSMSGTSIHQAKRALRTALDSLRSGDTFNIIAFNDSSTAFSDHFVPARFTELEQARRFVGRLETGRGTRILPALLRGMALMAGADPWPVQRIVLITDGAVENEGNVFLEVTRRLGRSRMHLIGIGSAPNRFFMRRLARFGRGTFEIIASLHKVEERMAAFLGRIDRPVMTDIELTWEGTTPRSVHPETLPDLHAGEPLLVSLRFDPGAVDTRAILTGRLADGQIRVELPIVAGAERGSGIGTRWARARVETYMDELYRGAELETIRKSVIDVASPFNLVTRFTSLVAVEQQPSADGTWTSLPVAGGLPHGSRLLGQLPSGGTLGPLMLLSGLLLIALGLLMSLIRVHLKA